MKTQSPEDLSQAVPVCDMYLSETGCEQHTLKQLSHPLQELVHVRPLQDVHLGIKHTVNNHTANPRVHFPPGEFLKVRAVGSIR